MSTISAILEPDSEGCLHLPVPEALRRLGQAPTLVSTQGATRLYEEIQDRPGSEIGYLLEFRETQIDEYLRKALPPPADWQAFRRDQENPAPWMTVREVKFADQVLPSVTKVVYGVDLNPMAVELATANLK